MAKKTALAPRPAADLPAIEAWDIIPDFQSENDEAEFWATHSLGRSILDQDPDLPNASRAHLIEVNSLDEVPDFASDEEPAAFWETHTFGPRWFDNVPELEVDSDLPRRARGPSRCGSARM